MYMAGQKRLIIEHLLYLPVCELLSSQLGDMDTLLSLSVSEPFTYQGLWHFHAYGVHVHRYVIKFGCFLDLSHVYFNY